MLLYMDFICYSYWSICILATFNQSRDFYHTLYSVLPIYRGRVYRGIGYSVVACWTPFFSAHERDVFHEIAVTPWTHFAGGNFSQNLLTAKAVVPRFAADNFSRNQLWPTCQCGRQFFTKSAHCESRCSQVCWRQFFAKSTLAYLSMRAVTHAVRWSAKLSGAMTPPLCRKVGSG